jgi:MFS family permease
VSDVSGTQAATDVPQPVPLRRNTGFRMLWIGQLLSGTGTEIGRLAYPLLILALTHSAVLAGAVGTARAMTVLCLQLPGGALSDRFDRRLTMIGCDAMRTVLLAVLAVLIVAHLASWPVILMATTALATLAPLTVGLLVQHVSGAWAVGAFAATMAVAAALTLILPGLRRADSVGERLAGQS